MVYVDIIGYIATILSVSSFMPQVIKSWKTRSTKDISLYMYLILGAAQIFWFTYGILTKSWPLVVTNVIVFSLLLSILIPKIRFG